MANKRWVQEGEKHVLYFTPFYDEEPVAEVFCEDDGGWGFSSGSSWLHTHAEYLGSDSLHDAKIDVEQLVGEHLENQRDYYADMARRFGEE